MQNKERNLVIVTSILVASIIVSFGVVYWTETLKNVERLEINITFEENNWQKNVLVNISNVGHDTVDLSDLRVGNSSNLLKVGFWHNISVVRWSRFDAGENWTLPVTYNWMSNTTYKVDVTTIKGSNFFVIVTSPSMR